MSVDKKAYFQGGGGVNQPEPKKKKYKSDPAIVVQPRFKEPFYRNYDLYNTPGEHSPGAGWHDMEKYKSIDEFLKAKRKKLKDKYKADDSWIMDDNSKTKKNPNIQARAAIFERIIKVAIDFPIDDEVNHDSMIYPIEDEYEIRREKGDRYQFPSDGSGLDPAELNISMTSPQIAGEHSYLPEADFAGRSDEALNFGRDYDDEPGPGRQTSDDLMEKLFNKYLGPSQTELFGLPDGIDPDSDLDAEQTEQVENPLTGTSDIGTNIYEDKWNI